MKITKLVIDRATWGQDCLLNIDGTMCCLGFLALKCGAAPDQIERCTDPESAPNIDWPAAFISIDTDDNEENILTNSNLAIKAMDINDSPKYSMSSREKKLIKLFKRANIALSFKGVFESEISNKGR